MRIKWSTRLHRIFSFQPLMEISSPHLHRTGSAAPFSLPYHDPHPSTLRSDANTTRRRPHTYHLHYRIDALTYPSHYSLASIVPQHTAPSYRRIIAYSSLFLRVSLSLSPAFTTTTTRICWRARTYVRICVRTSARDPLSAATRIVRGIIVI